jgi:hypothetical protein
LSNYIAGGSTGTAYSSNEQELVQNGGTFCVVEVRHLVYGEVCARRMNCSFCFSRPITATNTSTHTHAHAHTCSKNSPSVRRIIK